VDVDDFIAEVGYHRIFTLLSLTFIQGASSHFYTFQDDRKGLRDR
jgi:hypothetical protein